MPSLVRRFPRTTLLIINLVLLISLLLVIEFVLRRYFPFHLATIGHRESENAARYGWGFSPGESIQIWDPDTGETYVDSANSHGWRDKERSYENTKGAYRILVLGDSITFGAIVPEEKVYPHLLEEKLNKAGYNAEVINISYGGWGTDQELEALINEGLSYKPNLVIVEFCTNDLTDNTYYHDAVASEGASHRYLGWKPFYYDFDEHGSLLRNPNPNFGLSNSMTKKDRFREIALDSEIIKRVYAVYLHFRLRQQTAKTKYLATDLKLLQLELVIGLTKQSYLYKFLDERKGKDISADSLGDAVEASGFHDKKAIIERILEDRWFNEYWSVGSFRPSPANAASYEWKLYFALMSEIKNRSDSIHAEVAVLPETEQGHYEWSRSWYRVSDDEVTKVNYLSHIQVIRSAMNKLGIDVIENTEPYQRARNDPHPNAQGNQAMANDIFKHLVARSDVLKKYKNLRNP